MKRKKLIIGIFAMTLLAGLIAWTRPTGNSDLSKVTISFEQFETNNGQLMAVLCLTNGSSYRISQPDSCTYHWSSPSGSGGSLAWGTSMSISCGIVGNPPLIDWAKFKPPQIASIDPGESFRWKYPISDSVPSTPKTLWRLEASLATIPFKNRLPPVLRSCWPSSKSDKPIEFVIKSPEVLVPPMPDKSNPAGQEMKKALSWGSARRLAVPQAITFRPDGARAALTE